MRMFIGTNNVDQTMFFEMEAQPQVQPHSSGVEHMIEFFNPEPHEAQQREGSKRLLYVRLVDTFHQATR
jgi:hypothetical protein